MKNKEIEELLNELKEVTNGKKSSSTYCITNKHWQLLLSYIEQLEQCYCNRTDCSSRIKDSKKYDSLLQKYEQLENNRDKAIEILGQYKHYSTPTEEQNRENEDIVDNAYNILKGDDNASTN